jgi:ribose-phosphate pyrophosphokinase
MGFVRFGKIGNEFEVESFVFSGGEVQVKLPDGAKASSFVVNVCACIQSSDDLLKLILACDALRAEGYTLINLVMPYVPYARQDRRCNTGEAHSLRVFAQMINALKFYGVIVYDPHSDVVEALIDNVSVVPQEDIVHQMLVKNNYHVISPDGGALKKIYKVAKAIDAKSVIKADKLRDVTTGAITSTEVRLPVLSPKSFNDKYLVVDDLCDGGRTFIELAKECIAQGLKRENLELYVTHGIFSKGFDELLKYYSKIYTTNSFRHDINQEGVEVLNIWRITN